MESKGDRAEEEEEEDRGRTLPGGAPVEFHRRWRQRESVTATERKDSRQKKEEEEEEEGKERKKHIEKTDRQTQGQTLIERETNKDRHKTRERGFGRKQEKKYIHMRDRQKKEGQQDGHISSETPPANTPTGYTLGYTLLSNHPPPTPVSRRHDNWMGCLHTCLLNLFFQIS